MLHKWIFLKIVFKIMAKRCFEGVQHTKNYAIFRPSPPNSLIEHILSKMKNRDLAVDIGCGSGQNTKLLGIINLKAYYLRSTIGGKVNVFFFNIINCNFLSTRNLFISSNNS